jgi:hypothetical protein
MLSDRESSGMTRPHCLHFAWAGTCADCAPANMFLNNRSYRFGSVRLSSAMNARSASGRNVRRQLHSAC